MGDCTQVVRARRIVFNLHESSVFTFSSTRRLADVQGTRGNSIRKLIRGYYKYTLRQGINCKKFKENCLLFCSRKYEAMTSFFGDINSFRSWLDTKTEAELKSKLYRADPRARLNGSKPDLVRRLVETTRNFGMERQETIFPELRRRRRQEHLARIALPRQAAVGEQRDRRNTIGPRSI